MMSKPRFRYLQLDRSKMDVEKRTIPISFSSETEVARNDKELGDYYEVLSHDLADVDLSRMKDGAPFLVNHDPDDQVGVVEEALVGNDRMGRAVIRFGTSERAEEIFRDIKDGIRKHISVGYEPTDVVSDTKDAASGKRTVKFKWMPFEASTVAIPADTRVGVGRNRSSKLLGKAMKRTYALDECVYYVKCAEQSLIALLDEADGNAALEAAITAAVAECSIAAQHMCCYSSKTAAECVESSRECAAKLKTVLEALEASDIEDDECEYCEDCIEDAVEKLLENAGGEATVAAAAAAMARSKPPTLDSAPRTEPGAEKKPNDNESMKRNLLLDNKPADGGGGAQTLEQLREAEMIRTRGIRAVVDLICKNHPSIAEKVRKFGDEAVGKNEALVDFQTRMFTEIPGVKPAGELSLASIGLSRKEQERYSVTRAIQSCILRETKIPDGLEGEVHQEMVKRVTGVERGGFWVPPDAMVSKPMTRRQQRDLNVTTFGQGGAFVQTTILTPIIEILRNRMVCDRLGVVGMAGLEGNIAIPRQTAAATAYSVSEQAAATISTQTIDQILLTPHRVTAWNNYSRQLLLQSSVDVENFMRDDLMKVTAIKWDSLILQGQGGAEPTGILNTTGISSLQFGGTATWAEVVQFETNLALANADIGNMAYVTTPGVRGRWKAVAKTGVGVTSVVPIFLWDKGEWGDGSNDGEVNGYRAAATNQILNNLVFFGNWEDAIHALWGGYDVIVDPYSLATQATVRVTVNTFGDVAVRHPASFCVSMDAGNQ